MKEQNDITHQLGQLYFPQSALVFYQTEGNRPDTYVEYFDMDNTGMPVNAHPLTLREAKALTKALCISDEKVNCLQSHGMLSSHILHIDPLKGKAVWFTKSMQRQLCFTENLDLPNGKAYVPPMLWVADRQSLAVFALAGNRRPNEKTILYQAPFFNIYEDGKVCMGSVDVRIKKTALLEEFTKAWEDYFFNSYFSHLMAGYNPIQGNCVCLWKHLITTGETFPIEVLKKTDITLKDLLK
ncbi:PRTRC system protein B [Chryseobacterium sp. 'Rf worker isolate 10']|uniref:PRTRC system protein B n=1 Tax=Chryseobacterium sp. 'Rf worker isolate 10' TaxID=2887348 RepID=UPI003D6E5281